MTQSTQISRDTALSTVSRYLEAIAEATSPSQIAALYTDDATVEDPVGSETVRGKDAIAAFFAPLTQSQRDTELLNFRHCGDSAAFHFRVRTHTPDGVVEIEPLDVMTFTTDGLISSAKAYWSPEDVRMD
ncbi:MAG: steroid delta-isomerase [Gordonia sp.]|jgi:steroid delta-isomerase|uniref:Nuclear transport factor 2 family protein n=1 Tax=Gordonia rubripertincta TaxID=36822 RepID=A0ABT4MPJ9_GORRU|nr:MULTISPECIES: nuclear transport factor 2 family protein [Mycobacteriales]MBA4024013.1 steroid delta-isomerase [Gordonia sp. (in: high G+C Gram-positive bacteria)]MCZ4548918.1 nuclear transport factor 2 family protein [Gordonia rubripertincta]OZG28740.1 steroid delta-isomerase [Williamsia sp. 1138]